MHKLNGKTAFIAGGGGVGRGIAKTFAQAGMQVAMADIRADRLAIAELELQEITDKTLTLEVDTTQRSSLEAAAAATEPSRERCWKQDAGIC